MKENSEPNNIIAFSNERLLCDSFYRSVGVTVSTDPTFRAKVREEIIVGDFEIRGNITGNLGFGKKENIRKGPQVLLHRRKIRLKATNITEVYGEGGKSITSGVLGGTDTTTG